MSVVIPKQLTIVDDGGIYDIASQEEFKDLLNALETKYLTNIETGRRVIGFLSLVDGGNYRTKPTVPSFEVVSIDDGLSDNNDEGEDAQTQMAISNDVAKKGHNKNKNTTNTTSKRNAVIPKAIVVRRASITKRRARDSIGQRKQQKAERNTKRRLEKASELVKTGNELAKQGKYTDAMKSYRRVLKIRLKVLGKHHPNVASAFRNIGCILYAQGSYEEAMSMYQRALKIQVAANGNGHPDVGQLCYNMGKALQQQSKHEEAKKAFEKAQSIYMNLHGKEHAKVAEIRKSLHQVVNHKKTLP